MALTTLSNPKVIQFSHCIALPVLQHLSMADCNVELLIDSC